MSIEQNIEQLTIAVDRIAKALEAHLGLTLANAATAPVPVIPVVEVVAPAPVVVEAPVAPAPVATAPEMPPLPTFVAPVEPPKPVTPFTDAKSMIQYVTEAYKAMGPAKGARIQEVITGLGVVNINEIVPDHYAALYAGVEALRHGA